MLGRLAFFLLLGSLALAACAMIFDWRITLPPALADAIGWHRGETDEQIVDDDLKWYVNDKKIAGRIQDAVARQDAADAMLYLDIARRLDIPLAGGLEAAALAVDARDSSLGTQAYEYASGFASGTGDSIAGMAGAVTSDLTVYGDLRDIVSEGRKMIAGEDYSELTLGLSCVGLAATAATVATGGGGIVVKAGLSFLKFAYRGGHLTAEFVVRLLRLTNEAVDMHALRKTLREIDLADPEAAWKTLTEFAGSVKSARVFDVLGKIEEIRAAVGTREALRLLKRVKKIEDVDDIRDLVKVSGKRARGIMELTGKESLRAIKYTAHILQLLFHYVWTLIVWIGSLLLAILHRVLVSAWRLLRMAMRFARRRRRPYPGRATEVKCALTATPQALGQSSRQRAKNTLHVRHIPRLASRGKVIRPDNPA